MFRCDHKRLRISRNVKARVIGSALRSCIAFRSTPVGLVMHDVHRHNVEYRKLIWCRDCEAVIEGVI